MSVSTRASIQATPVSLRIYQRFFVAAFVSGVAAAFYFGSEAAIAIVGICVLLALTIIYAVLARLFDWPRFRWREVFNGILDLMMI